MYVKETRDIKMLLIKIFCKEYLEFYIKNYPGYVFYGLENFNTRSLKLQRDIKVSNNKNNYTIPLEIKYFDTSKKIGIKL